MYSHEPKLERLPRTDNFVTVRMKPTQNYILKKDTMDYFVTGFILSPLFPSLYHKFRFVLRKNCSDTEDEFFENTRSVLLDSYKDNICAVEFTSIGATTSDNILYAGLDRIDVYSHIIDGPPICENTRAYIAVPATLTHDKTTGVYEAKSTGCLSRGVICHMNGAAFVVDENFPGPKFNAEVLVDEGHESASFAWHCESSKRRRCDSSDDV